jgi:hypothetical protein
LLALAIIGWQDRTTFLHFDPPARAFQTGASCAISKSFRSERWNKMCSRNHGQRLFALLLVGVCKIRDTHLAAAPMKSQQELDLPAVLPKTTTERVDILVDLLRSATSLAVVSDFLKSKNARFSAGSWEEMKKERIIPAFQRGKINVSDLQRLLSEAEEFGRSHIFLYRTEARRIAHLFDEARLRTAAKSSGVERRLDEPLIINIPDKPTLAEIRLESASSKGALVVKVIEPRVEQVLQDEKVEADRIIRSIELKKVRAVNVARLHASGFLELRLQSHVNSTKYAADVARMWTTIQPILPQAFFGQFSLAKAKKELLGHRKGLEKTIRFSNSTMRNSHGITISASVGAVQGSLFEDTSTVNSIDVFMKGGGRCDSTSVWWLPVNGAFDREVHCYLGGHDNEFAIPAACTRAQYDYALDKIRAFSR